MKEFTPLEYLQMDIAARHSMDKHSWTDRQIWFHLNKDRLLEHVDTAKDPALYFAAVCAYQDYLDGKPSGYAVSLDQTASGIQLLSAMAKDLKSASNCNVVGDTCKDFYIEAFKVMQEVDEGLEIDRDDLKAAIMTAFYGSIVEPLSVFGEERIATFYAVMEEMAPRAWHLNQTFLNVVNDKALRYDWVLPDNFDASSEVIVKEKEYVLFKGIKHTIIREVNKASEYNKSMGANLTHSVEAYLARELIRRTKAPKQVSSIKVPVPEKDTMVQILWELYQQSGMLSVRILDYLTKYNIKYVDESIIEGLYDKFSPSPFDVLTTHDCFRCLPKYANDLRYIYADLFRELADSNMAIFLIETVTGIPLEIELDNELEGHEIGEYLIC